MIALVLLALSFTSEAAMLVIDGNPTATFPKRYRVINHTIGSGQFSQQQLQHIITEIHSPIIIIDLRQEAHGFINGTPISWYATRNWDNKGKTAREVNQIQMQKLNYLRSLKNVTVYDILKKSHQGKILDAKPINMDITDVYNEQQLAQHLKLGYVRFYVTDHMAPTETEVNAFVSFFKTAPKDSWLYFHCRGGSGRTTTFMVMTDILRDGKTKTFDEIITKQRQSGSKDLSILPSKSNYKYNPAMKRLEFLKQFYNKYAQ